MRLVSRSRERTRHYAWRVYICHNLSTSSSCCNCMRIFTFAILVHTICTYETHRHCNFFPRHAVLDILSQTNLLVMIDDPIISTKMAEFILQTESGLSMGSRTSGLVNPCGSLMLTSNSHITAK